MMTKKIENTNGSVNIMDLYASEMDRLAYRENIEINDAEDILQDAVIALLTKKENVFEKGKVSEKRHQLNIQKKKARIDLYRKHSGKSIHDRDEKINMNFETIETLSDTVFDDREKRSFQDTIDYIKTKLTQEEYKIFDLYFLQDKTRLEIQNSLGLSSFTTTKRMTHKMINRLHHLKISELYDHRYLQTGGTCKGQYPDKIPKTEKDLQWIEWNQEQVKGFEPAQKVPMTVKDNKYAMSINGDCSCLRDNVSFMAKKIKALNWDNNFNTFISTQKLIDIEIDCPLFFNPIRIIEHAIPYGLKGLTYGTWLHNLWSITLNGYGYIKHLTQQQKQDMVLLLAYYFIPQTYHTMVLQGMIDMFD